MRLRESSLERLRRSRLESEERLLDMERSRRTAEALADSRQRSAERIRQIETESRIRQAQIEEDARLRELSRIRDDELRRSRERAF
jgi:membrane protein involved in colicin uptake